MRTSQNVGRTIVKNASANLVRIAVSGIVGLAVPPFLSRVLPAETYGTWALLLQVTAYVGFLDLGIQTSVARFVAHAGELDDSDQRDGIVSTAFACLVAAALIGLCLISLLAWQLPHVFKAMPFSLLGEARVALVLMGASYAVGLPVNVVHAIFIGEQRNRIPVALLIANKSMVALLTVIIVVLHRGVAAMAVGVTLANLLSYAAAYFAWRVFAPHVRFRKVLVSWSYAKQLAGYSAVLAVWSLGMLLVSGFDLTIVGIFDYRATAYYAVAATVANFIAQTQSAISAALMPASAALNAKGDSKRLRDLLLLSTRYGMLILLATTLPLILAGRPILTIWVGDSYAAHSTSIMLILLVANLVRLSLMPYATLLLGTGEHKKIVLSPLAEGVTNMIVSVIGAKLFGAIGVALGTLIGSFVSLGAHFLYNMPRTRSIAISRALLVKEGLFRPLLCALPCGLALILCALKPDMRVPVGFVLKGTTVLGTGYLIWKYGLISSERQRLEDAFHL